MPRTKKANKVEEPKTAEAVVETAKETAAETTVRKTRTAAKKAVSTVYVQYEGLEVNVEDVTNAAKAAWGGKKGDIETFALYIKPEEKTAYYVVNGTDTGSVAL